MVHAVIDSSYEAWHEQARALLAAAIPPEDVVWAASEAHQPLLDGAATPAPKSATGRVTVPRKFVGLATLAAHDSPL